MPSHNTLTIDQVEDLNAVAATAAQGFAEVLSHVRATGGKHGDHEARVVLTGGGAGIATLRQIRSLGLNCTGVHFYFGDERNVPVDDPESNEGQARASLLEHLNIPETHIHGYGLGAGRDLEEAARDYKQVLASTAPQGFDLHLLGMGSEGHINSLFPHAAALDAHDKLVVAVHDSPKPPAQRVSLTLKAVNSSDEVWLLVAGEEKALAASKVAFGADPHDWPAAGARGRQRTRLIVAADAATAL